MREHYQHLCEKDREVIYRMNKAGKSQTEIASILGRSQGTISKELKRNKSNRGYRPKHAQNTATKRKKSKVSRKRIIVGELKDLIEQRLRLRHSPMQVSGWLGTQGVQVSHETIYSYIIENKRLGGDLYKHLRTNSKRRYRKRVKEARVGKIKDRVGIEKRPKVVDKKLRYGDWEVDLIEGSKGSGFLLSVYERKSHLGKLYKLESKSSEETACAIMKVLKGYKVKSLTYDNGLEFSQHLKISKSLNTKGYFCKPYHSWEKGGVENFNGLVRQYYPKGSSFRSITPEHLQQTEDEINQRPRETLKFKSPAEIEHKIAA